MTDLNLTKQQPSPPAVAEKKQEQMNERAARNLLMDPSVMPITPHALLQEVDKISKKYRESKNKKDLEKELIEKINAALPVVALDTHYALARAVMEELRPFAIEFSNQLIEEYNCKTPTEKALVETIAAAYVRILQSTRVITGQVRVDHCSPALNDHYRVASQELDRANRHFINAIATLKQLKSPAMTIQVKATNAFVAQNQQVNATSPDLSAGNEKKTYETVGPT